MATYVVSDLHGQYDLFIKGLENIGFSDDDEIYVIGDAIDRGPDGIQLLMHIKEQKNMSLILGNHEVMMLLSIDADEKEQCTGYYTHIWHYLNCGIVTNQRYDELPEKDRKSLLMWLNRCYVMKTIDLDGRKICLTHSYYSEELENKMYFECDKDEVWDCVWKSMFREDIETRGSNIYKHYDYEFITGHVPVQRVRASYEESSDYNVLSAYKSGNLVDIDGGCAMGHKSGLNNGAIFLRLDDMEEFPVYL